MSMWTPGVYILSQSNARNLASTAQLFLAVMVTVTCFTTTVGLIVSTAEFLTDVSLQISYKVYATSSLPWLVLVIAKTLFECHYHTLYQFSLFLYPPWLLLLWLWLWTSFVPLSKTRYAVLTVAWSQLLPFASVLGSTFKIDSLANIVNALTICGGFLRHGWHQRHEFTSLVLPNKQVRSLKWIIKTLAYAKCFSLLLVSFFL